MKIKGVLFDKDGTLLEFDRTWRPIAIQVVEEVAAYYDFHDKSALAAAIGLYPESIDPLGSLSAGTNKDVALDMHSILIRDGMYIVPEEHIRWSTELFNKVAASFPFYVVEGVEDTIRKLKAKGILVGLSTADSVENATLFLEKTGLLPYFDYIGADDGIINPKPASDYMEVFCERYSLQSQEVAVIGDTMADMNFGINSKAGFIAGVLSGTGTRGLLSNSANVVIGSVKDLFKDDRPIWEEM